MLRSQRSHDLQTHQQQGMKKTHKKVKTRTVYLPKVILEYVIYLLCFCLTVNFYTVVRYDRDKMRIDTELSALYDD